MLQDASHDKNTESTVMADDFTDLERQCGLNVILMMLQVKVVMTMIKIRLKRIMQLVLIRLQI